MRALLDTHSFLWWAEGGANLSDRAYKILADPTNELLLSSVVMIEVAILVYNNKIALARPVKSFFEEQISLFGWKPFPISIDHVDRVSTLPLNRQHKDPHDRLLIAQGLFENLPIVSCDARFPSYGVQTLW